MIGPWTARRRVLGCCSNRGLHAHRHNHLRCNVEPVSAFDEMYESLKLSTIYQPVPVRVSLPGTLAQKSSVERCICFNLKLLLEPKELEMNTNVHPLGIPQTIFFF
jgi:hypothetical protein